MSTIALYARISSDKQEDNFSIETQLKLMREFATKEGFEIIELPEVGSAFNEGLSRSKLQEALRLAREGHIQTLLFFSPDRFTRDIADGVILRRELRRYGVSLMCFHPYPRTIDEDMEIMHILTDWQSQQYVMKMRDASMRSLRGKADMGLYTQGNIVYGYKLTGKKHDTTVEVVPEEAQVVRHIYHMYLYEEVPVTEIVQRLQAEHIPARKGAWTVSSVRSTLTNETYTGVWYAFRWYRERTDGKSRWRQRPKEEGVSVSIPAIIDKAVWSAVQNRLKTRTAGRRLNVNYLMSGRLSCQCGLASIGQSSNNGRGKLYAYYRCNGIQYKNHCGISKFRSDAVDETVWHFAYELMRNPEKLLLGLRSLQEEGGKEREFRKGQIETLAQNLVTMQEELSSLVDQRTKAKAKSLQTVLDTKIEEYAASIDELEARIRQLEMEEEDLLSDEGIAQLVHEVDSLRAVTEALEHINETADFSAKRALIVQLNLRATLRVDAEGQKWVDIQWLRSKTPHKLWVQNGVEGAA